MVLGVDLLKVEKHCHLSLFDSLLQKNWYLEEVYDCEKACSNFNAKVSTGDEFHQLNFRKGFEQNWWLCRALFLLFRLKYSI